MSLRARRRLRVACSAILGEALRAAEPGRLVEQSVTWHRGELRVSGEGLPVPGRIALVAAGKAAVAMAAAAERSLGSKLAAGLAVSTTAAGPRLLRTRLLLAGHPLPDARGLVAAAEVERLAEGLGGQDVLLVLLSGGASALLPAPVEGLSLQDEASTTRLLLRAGAPIQELNAVRKHLSRLKGGGLAHIARPARVVTLVLSDVVGDDLSTVASGPTVPDPTTFADALLVLGRRGVKGRVPRRVLRRLERGAAGQVAETAKPGDPAFRRDRVRIVGSNRLSLAAAAAEAKRQGLRPLVLTTRLAGEAREVARLLVAILRECVESGQPAAPPVCLLAGGETTVTVRGNGQGGRNQELAVAAAEALAGFPVPAVVASLATDGIDGWSDAAGGVVDDRTEARAATTGLAPAASFLAANDSRNYLGPLGELILLGATGTNVIDVVALLAGDPRRRGL